MKLFKFVTFWAFIKDHLIGTASLLQNHSSPTMNPLRRMTPSLMLLLSISHQLLGDDDDVGCERVKKDRMWQEERNVQILEVEQKVAVIGNFVQRVALTVKLLSWAELSLLCYENDSVLLIMNFLEYKLLFWSSRGNILLEMFVGHLHLFDVADKCKSMFEMFFSHSLISFRTTGPKSTKISSPHTWVFPHTSFSSVCVCLCVCILGVCVWIGME